MAEDDEGFGFSGGDGVLRVKDPFPLASLADDEYIHIGAGKIAYDALQVGIARIDGDAANLQLGVADDADGAPLEFLAGIAGEGGEGGLGHDEKLGALVGAKAVPREDLEHAGAYAVGAAGVPVVVKAEDGHVVRFEERTLGGVDGVGGESGGGVFVIVEGGLVGDDEVTAGLGGALQNVEGGHHGGGDALDRRIGGAGFKGVHRGVAPGHPEVGLNALDHLANSERGLGGEANRRPRS